jgi:hypothetical protein
MTRFYSPIDKLAEQLPRPKGTGAEFMADLSKRPGYKPQEAEDRGLHALSQLPKMVREEFLAALKAKRPPKLESDENGDETKYENYQLPGGKNYTETLVTLPEHKGENYTSSHWDEPNVLAHLRTSDRNVDGKKLLHIEELQSDWHQAGREHGYKGKDSLDNVNKAQSNYFDLQKEMMQAKNEGSNTKIMELMPKVMAAEDAFRKAGQLQAKGVPDAPFKKDWHELALKHAIQEAVKGGYHGIVITPGQEQADRYKLSKQVGTVSYNPEEKHFQAFKPNRETVLNEKDATPERVSELIGKEAAARLMAAPQTMGHHTLEGEDLNVGGEGMKGFYDKMIPNFLDKFGKKYGAKVALHAFPIEHKQWELKGQMPVLNEKLTMAHHFPITEEMRADIKANGLPMYAKGGEVEPEEFKAKEHVNHKAEGGPVPPQRIDFDALKASFGPQIALKNQYDKETAGLYTRQLPTFAQWLAAQGKAEGGSIKPIGYTKEKVTVAPDLNAMKYEMMSVKHFTKKAK